MKIQLVLFLFMIFTLNSEAQIKKKYQQKFDNRITSMTKEISEDSLDYYYNNFTMVNFNFHNEEIKKGFNYCMKAIEKNGYLDSIIVQNRFGKAADKIRISLNFRVPFQISNAIIRYFYENNDDLEILFRAESPKGSKNRDRFPNRKYSGMLVGALYIHWDSRLKTITKDETIKELLNIKNQEEYVQFFLDNDENHWRFESHMNKLIGRAHFDGCESIENIEVRIECADDKYREYVEENLYNKLKKRIPLIGLNVLFDENGKIVDVEITNPDILENPQEILDFWYAMPNWIPAEINGKPAKKSMYLEMVNRKDYSETD